MEKFTAVCWQFCGYLLSGWKGGGGVQRQEQRENVWELGGNCGAIVPLYWKSFFFFVSAHLNVTNQMATKRAQKNAG